MIGSAMRPTRRAIALLLLFLVPLQYTWAAASLHEHPEEASAGELLHIGSHPAAPDTGAGGGQADGGDGHHCHHVPSLITVDSGLSAGSAPPGKPAAAPAGTHASHIPPVRDRPPRDLP
ncbi:MAG: hypothetical protein IT486_12935 [Gammaproteobacteria bacterium]|nr:hypothetical protein [Gammaproteobacteria bacterium]